MKIEPCSSEDILAERQTKRYTDILITILQYLRTSYRGVQGDECILCHTTLQVTTGVIANVQHEFLNFNIFADGPL